MQHDISLQCYHNRKEIETLSNEVNTWINNTNALAAKAKGKNAAELKTTTDQLQKFLDASTSQPGLDRLSNAFASIFSILQEADMTPTTQTLQAFKAAQASYESTKASWSDFKKTTLPKMNKQLKSAGLPFLSE